MYYLIKRHILSSETRIGQLWPAPITKQQRTKRSYHQETSGWHDSGMDFPSSEGALMTLSFLTFAVFLIKLVLVN